VSEFPGVPRFPVDAYQVVRQDNAGHALTGSYGHFEWVPFDLIRNRADQHQAGLRVVCFGAQHQCRASPSLLAAGLRVEGQPDEIAGARQKDGAYQDSLPCGRPQSVSR
jgi:hypothetical protein